jgi:hypothetical protein
MPQSAIIIKPPCNSVVRSEPDNQMPHARVPGAGGERSQLDVPPQATCLLTNPSLDLKLI